MSTPGDDGWLAAGTADPGDVASYYDGWAANYDGDLDSWEYLSPRIVADLIGECCPDANEVLDAGCGTGLAGRALRASGHAGPLVGIDLSELSLEIAGRDGTYTAVSRGDLQQPLPFGDDVFDAVMCVGVMTYVPDVESCWREFARVVRSGGVVVVTQREDVWHERRTAAVVERFERDGTWTSVQVSGPEPYLPGHVDFADRIGVYYVVSLVS
ncbi:MAG: class I SAM-dependent methyltransferase [Ilumatobacteraceae bacterium]